jgi:CRP-like cAMP-binding protein
VTTTPELDLAAALRGSRLFAELPQADVAALAATSRSVDLLPGEVLMSEGSPPDAMYVVTDGELEITRHSTGTELLLNVCGPGDLIGELGVAHGRPAERRACSGSAPRHWTPCSPTRRLRAPC